MVFDFSRSSLSTSYRLPGTVEPWFQVSILTATVLMNRFHQLIPGFFSCYWALFSLLTFQSAYYLTPSPHPNILEACYMTYQNQISQPGSQSPPSFWPYFMCSESALSHTKSLQPFFTLPAVKPTWSSPKSWSLLAFIKSFLFPSTHASSLCIPIVFIISSL